MNPEINDQSQYPAVFSFSYGGWGGESAELKWENGVLFYRPNIRTATTTLSPTVNDWKRFWAVAEAVNLWQWREEYMNDEVLDGVQWGLKIKFQERKIVCAGSNAFPGFEDGPELPDDC